MNKDCNYIEVANIDSFAERAYNSKSNKIKMSHRLMTEYNRSLVRDDIEIFTSLKGTHTEDCLMVSSRRIGLFNFAFLYNFMY